MSKETLLYRSMNGSEYRAKILKELGTKVNIELLDEGEIFINVPKNMIRVSNEKKK